MIRDWFLGWGEVGKCWFRLSEVVTVLVGRAFLLLYIIDGYHVIWNSYYFEASALRFWFSVQLSVGSGDLDSNIVPDLTLPADRSMQIYFSSMLVNSYSFN